MSQLYQAANSNHLILHSLDSMSLVFHKTSGITHMVANPVPAILEVMASRPMSATTIAEKLSITFDVVDAVDVEEVVVARLKELCALGLVEAVPN